MNIGVFNVELELYQSWWPKVSARILGGMGIYESYQAVWFLFHQLEICLKVWPFKEF